MKRQISVRHCAILITGFCAAAAGTRYLLTMVDSSDNDVVIYLLLFSLMIMVGCCAGSLFGQLWLGGDRGARDGTVIGGATIVMVCIYYALLIVLAE